MRVTHHGIVENVIASIQGQLQNLAESQEQVSTGMRVGRPSDDPFAAAQMVSLDSELSRSDQYKRNIDSGMHYLRTTEEALTQVSDMIVRARATAIQGGNDAMIDSDRRRLAQEVERMIDELLPIVNQRIGNQYLFGGTETRTPPYESTTDADGKVTDVTLMSPEPGAPFELTISKNDRIETKVFGSDVFDGAGDSIFTVLIDLRNSLESGDSAAVTANLEDLDSAFEQIEDTVTMVGSRINSLMDLTQRKIDNDIRTTERLSVLGDVDLIDALIRLEEDRTKYELALRTSAKVIQPSLVNFVYL